MSDAHQEAIDAYIEKCVEKFEKASIVEKFYTCITAIIFIGIGIPIILSILYIIFSILLLIVKIIGTVFILIAPVVVFLLLLGMLLDFSNSKYLNGEADDEDEEDFENE